MRVALLVIVTNLPRGPQSKLMYILKYSTSRRENLLKHTVK